MDTVSPYGIPNPKINPAGRGPLKPDGSPDDEDRVEIGPTDLAFAEWAALGLEAPSLARLRETRLQRICGELQARDYAGALLFDPLNIRYATDSSNMHLWIAHNPARAAFVSVDGYVVLWDFHRCGHLSAHLPLVREVREGAGFFYFLAGDAEEARAGEFADQVGGRRAERYRLMLEDAANAVELLRKRADELQSLLSGTPTPKG